ncbi:MAG: hypothetical protein NUV49_03115 [Patescibacteria group bacterium]|nr:hypothetical protein [Patescibacteria group bacterium]
MTDTTHGYSVWLVPEGAVGEYLQRVISDLSMKYETPTFEPHVTLISGMDRETEALEYTVQIARRLRPFYIELGVPQRGDKYFRSLFAEVKETPELMEANKVAQKVCGKKEIYKPHLSLLYGELGGEVSLHALAYVRSRFQQGGGFPVVNLFLYKNEVDPWRWQRIAGFKIRTY